MWRSLQVPNSFRKEQTSLEQVLTDTGPVLGDSFPSLEALVGWACHVTGPCLYSPSELQMRQVSTNRTPSEDKQPAPRVSGERHLQVLLTMSSSASPLGCSHRVALPFTHWQACACQWRALQTGQEHPPLSLGGSLGLAEVLMVRLIV